MRSIGDIDNRVHGVEHLEVDNSINSHSDRVFGQNLLRWNIKGDGSEVDSDNGVKTWENKEQSRTHSSTFLDLAKSKDDSSLIFLKMIGGCTLISYIEIHGRGSEKTYLKHIFT